MKKYVIRREFLKLRINGKTNKECEYIIKERYGKCYTKNNSGLTPTLERRFRAVENDVQS